jgi:hypothetical protein
MKLFSCEENSGGQGINRYLNKFSLCLLILCASVIRPALAQQLMSAPEPQAATIIGTVLDANEGTVPGATVVLEGPALTGPKRVETNDNGFFELDHVKPATSYHVTVGASGFVNWTSPEITLKPGQFLELTGIRLRIATSVTTVNAVLSTKELAREQLNVEEKQRILSFIPNFYVVYDHNAVPLTAKMKYELALKVSIDPITLAGTSFLAGLNQAANHPDYAQGAKGYGQRFGALYANDFTDVMVGGAILPSILHQDPRYFYQGTGTTKSRMLHALSYPFICRGDNGRPQPNYSSLGGYLASGALSNAYYPASNRGPGLVFSTALIDISASIANNVLQEFLLRKLTPSVRNQN